MARLDAWATHHDALAKRYQYLGGRDPNTKQAAINAATRRAWHEQHARDIRMACAALSQVT